MGVPAVRFRSCTRHSATPRIGGLLVLLLRPLRLFPLSTKLVARLRLPCDGQLAAIRPPTGGSRLVPLFIKLSQIFRQKHRPFGVWLVVQKWYRSEAKRWYKRLAHASGGSRTMAADFN